MNRGSEDRRIPARPRQVTSMRPRFMNRGSQKTLRLPSIRRYDFNEAPIHESGK